ncbi:MAG: AAA family ATPase [Chroococcidiopsidaceae cyanobacterium CP_BM_ER_R8_30]|nr:AAA family ATPase [Chroococcidiopsidaceae cyanobacterium CP_BM_ER_R8_30]
MKLLSIRLCNFRQFYGKTPEIFLAHRERNTTIIHGNNGSGKTTILNAFTWVLYEKFSAAFASVDKLVNKRAIAEVAPGEPVECWVEIGFEHDSKKYKAKRLCRAYKGDTIGIEHSKSELYLQVAGDDGCWLLPQQHPDDIIGRILPASLHQYFFFDGERIEQIFRDDKKSEIAEATKDLLGLKVLDRSIEHLKNAKRTLEEELAAIGDTETRNLLREKENTEQRSEALSKRQSEIDKELENQNDLKREISGLLLKLGGAEELQQLRDRLEAEAVSIRSQLQQTKNVRNRVISTRGYTVFLLEITAGFRVIVNDLRSKGELPTGIKRTFVKELLERERCICGTELTNGSHPHALVQEWMERSGTPDVEETAIRMESQINEIDQQATEFWQEVDQQQEKINKDRIELSRIETQLDDIKKKLLTYPDENISNLQKRLDGIEERIRELILEKGANKQKIETLKTEIEAKAKQIAKYRMKEDKQAIAQRRITATQDAIERLTEVRTGLDQQFRLQLEKRVQEIFSQISFTPYIPNLSEKYELTLLDVVSGELAPVAASTGENQILSLSFIGGIIDRVREWSQKNALMGPDSSTLPVVMDSPFGSLDEIYRRQIAKTIPKLANQLVVLVTKTQWRGEVAQEMATHIGKEYVLSYNSPKPNCEVDVIELGSEFYPLVRQSSSEFEYTEIIEVRRDG